MEITLLHQSFNCSVDKKVWDKAIKDIKEKSLKERERIKK